MEARSDHSPPASEVAEIPPFRIRTAHFLLLTTVSAVILALRLNWVRWDEIPSDVVGYFRLQESLLALLYGAACTAVLIMVGRHRRFGRSELQYPGHWLLCFFATVALIAGATGVILKLHRHYHESPNVAFYSWNLEKLLLCSAVGTCCFVYAWLMAGNWWWKSVLAMPGAVLLALVPQHVLVYRGVWHNWFGAAHDYASLGVSAALLPLLACACLTDFRRGLPRDWLHWSGVLVVTLAAGMEFAWGMYWFWNSS